MIIVSQNKESFYVLENVYRITLDDENENEKSIWIQNRDVMHNLGEYKTRERAKEVLQELINFYNRSDYPKEKVEPLTGIGIIYNRMSGLYYMPEE